MAKWGSRGFPGRASPRPRPCARARLRRGGFYDTFLADFPGTTVGLCRTCQLSAVPLPRGPYDLPVGLVVTEDGDIIL